MAAAKTDVATTKPAAGGRAELNALLLQSEKQIARALPKHLTAERMCRVAMTAYSKTPELQKCSAMSIVACVLQASEMGLELTGPLGQAYMIPRWNKKTGSNEATFQIGYRGLIDLAYRSGRVKTFCAHVVHQNDTFDYQYGSDPKLVHKPTEANRGDVTHVYAICIQTNGGVDFEVMSFQDIVDHANQYSDGVDKPFSPWKTAWKEMAKKTAIRRLAKRVPLSIEFTAAAVSDEYREAGISVDGDEPNIVVNDIRDDAPKTLGELKQRLDSPVDSVQPTVLDNSKSDDSVEDIVQGLVDPAPSGASKKKPSFDPGDGIR